jgi:hypothetical protein
VVELKAGTLLCYGNCLQTAGTTTVDAGTVLGGTLIKINGGTLTGTGTIQAPVNNSGLVSPGGLPGTLVLGSGKDYQQGTSGRLHIEIGGHSPGTQYDQLVVGGNATLGGTLELVFFNGFVPQPGDGFQVLTCASQAGQFAQINAPAANGTVWIGRYSGTNVSAVLANQISITQPVLSGGTFGFSFNTTTGVNYVVQKTDSLNPVNWQTLQVIPGDGSTKTAYDPTANRQRYYRILLQ